MHQKKFPVPHCVSRLPHALGAALPTLFTLRRFALCTLYMAGVACYVTMVLIPALYPTYAYDSVFFYGFRLFTWLLGLLRFTPSVQPKLKPCILVQRTVSQVTMRLVFLNESVKEHNTPRTARELDHLDPKLMLRDVAQDLYTTDRSNPGSVS